MGGREVDEFPDRMLFACCDHEVFGRFLLQHQPLHLDVIAGMAPISQGIQITLNTVLTACPS